MEDLWKVKNSGIDMNDLEENMAEYKHLIDRFNKEEETINRRNLLHGDIPQRSELPVKSDNA